jgi:dTDP-4-amino-4,6-dideoxygalactose transaminase
MTAKIKFQDLTRLHESIHSELTEVFQETLRTSAFIQGPAVKNFEAEFAQYTGSKHCIGVANGTDALEIALEAFELPPESGIVLPSMTFAATAEAVVRQGLKPVFAEIDENTGCVTLETLEEAIRQSPIPVRGMIVVHLYGRACDMPAISAYCARTGIKLLEDCAQSHGAVIGGKQVGTWGDAATFSFYPGKNLGALGDAGAITTQSDELAARLKMLRDHGRSGKYVHDRVGRNSRLDGLQAAFLSVKLRHLPTWTKQRQSLAQTYRKAFEKISGFSLLSTPNPLESHVYHLMVGKLPHREELIRSLSEKGIEALIHYPIPLHQQKAFSMYATRALPKTETFAASIVSLPFDPLMSEEEIQIVADSVRGFLQSGSKT